MDQMVSEGPCTDSIFKSDSTAFEDMRKEIGRQMEAAKKYYGNQ
jgi:hypothetical protein